jgi:N-acetylmuramoyl-L-alanine amidase
VSLQTWAESNQLHYFFERKEEQIRLTNHSAHVQFKLNSLRAEVNGVAVFLSSPVSLHQGVPSISQRELDVSLTPILFPSKSKTVQPVKVLAIGAGHGGKDCGNVVGWHQEKMYTLLLTKELQRLAQRAGFKTVMIRTSDEFVDLEDRARLAKRGKADIYLELHYNCAGGNNSESRGVEVYCLTPAGANSTNGGSDQYPPLAGNRHDERNMQLAFQLQNALVDHLGSVDRGVRRARFVVLRYADMPAALIEAGFMSNPDEFRKIEDPNFRHRTAEAILEGVLAYRRSVER